MPIMDGLEAVKRIRTLESNYTSTDSLPRHILIIGVSVNWMKILVY
jgi:CheY-like chemotaxis protein